MGSKVPNYVQGPYYQVNYRYDGKRFISEMNRLNLGLDYFHYMLDSYTDSMSRKRPREFR
ncbi:MAG: hypothetical protein EU541_06845 [Promethearchaeota archaeon]|nr:MAG: hypothetical protein EU541_06845 [Candidatus Lokiarchaeota archaeon]